MLSFKHLARMERTLVSISIWPARNRHWIFLARRITSLSLAGRVIAPWLHQGTITGRPDGCIFHQRSSCFVIARNGEHANFTVGNPHAIGVERKEYVVRSKEVWLTRILSGESWRYIHARCCQSPRLSGDFDMNRKEVFSRSISYVFLAQGYVNRRIGSVQFPRIDQRQKRQNCKSHELNQWSSAVSAKLDRVGSDPDIQINAQSAANDSCRLQEFWCSFCET